MQKYRFFFQKKKSDAKKNQKKYNFFMKNPLCVSNLMKIKHFRFAIFFQQVTILVTDFTCAHPFFLYFVWVDNLAEAVADKQGEKKLLVLCYFSWHRLVYIR